MSGKKWEDALSSNCTLQDEHLERGLPMDIISIIAGLLKDTKSLIEFEEQLKLLMQKAFTQWVG
ncbi:MAG: hypothetical protein LKH78_04765, partial [Weizmannia coagulans]|nr:hypothetical protein [Heyndrickxia coagulans]